MEISKLTKEKILNAIDNNDEHIINQIYLLIRKFLHKNRVYNEDNLQDCALRVFTKLDTFDNEKALFSTWLYRVCKNVILMKNRKENALKRHHLKSTISLDDPYSDGITYADIIQYGYDQEEKEKIECAREIYNDCISDLLRDWLNGVNQTDLAKRYNCTQATICRRIKKEIKIIQKELNIRGEV